MKNLLLILSILLLSFKIADQEVNICDDKKASVYHYDINCKVLLKKCKSGHLKVTVEYALKHEYKPCKVCCKKK